MVSKGKSKDSSTSSEVTDDKTEASTPSSSSSSSYDMKILPAKNMTVPDPKYEVLRCSDDLDEVFNLDADKTLTPSSSSVRPVPSAAKKPRLVSKEDIFLSTDEEEASPSPSPSLNIQPPVQPLVQPQVQPQVQPPVRPPVMLLTRVFLRELKKMPSPCLLQIITIVRTTAANEVGKFGMNVVIHFFIKPLLFQS